MNLTTNDFATLATLVLAVILMAHRDDPRAWKWVKSMWSGTVGTWCARRRMVGSFAKKRRARIRVPRPDEHSRGIMVARRDINTGIWT